MYPLLDLSYEDNEIARVEKYDDDNSYSITFTNGWTFGVPSNTPVVPTVGMTARLYGKGIGYIVRGLFLDGQEVFYRTESEEAAKHLQEVEENKQKKKQDFEEKRASYDARVAVLPEIFQQRIQKFRDNNDEFRWEFEPYELFCCEEAVKLAMHFKDPEALQKWSKLDYNEQKKQFPLLDEGHSGNTFGCAVSLATLYLKDPSYVYLAHGALTPLVGCEEYGCVHPR